jgi:hypothetical protein
MPISVGSYAYACLLYATTTIALEPSEEVCQDDVSQRLSELAREMRKENSNQKRSKPPWRMGCGGRPSFTYVPEEENSHAESQQRQGAGQNFGRFVEYSAAQPIFFVSKMKVERS